MDKIFEILSWFFEHMSGAGYWYKEVMIEQGGSEAYEGIVLMYLLVIGIYTLCNIVNWISNVGLETFMSILMLFTYIIINIFIMTIIALIGLSIGAVVGFIVLGILWIIASIIDSTSSIDSEVNGIFVIFGYFKNYTISYNVWKNKIYNWKREYNQKKIQYVDN